MTEEPIKPRTGDLIQDIRQLIDGSRARVASTINAAMTTLYWQIGKRINDEILQGKRAEYGKQIVSTVSRQLQEDYGKGFSAQNIRHMIRFSEVFPEKQIVSTVSRQLSWSHFKEVIYLKDPLQRGFYAEMCSLERWSVRTLRERIDSMLYERTALSRKPKETIQADLQQIGDTGEITAELVLKDPYVLDFLELNDRYLERDLEDAILRDLEQFFLEQGAGFTFVARQKRIEIDNEDFYIDLLFYNRALKRLVALDLKLGKFKAEHKGQMELYLRWLDKHDRQQDENPPLGIILCAGKKEEQIKLLELDLSGIHVAEYLTVLPPREILEKKLHQAIQQSRRRLESRRENGK